MDLDIEMADTADVYVGDHDQPLVEHADQPPQPQPPSEDLDLQAPVPNKVHIRGLDVLTTAAIRTYVADHHGLVSRVEWIDDTSANLVFDTDAGARDAIIALAAVPLGDPSLLAPGETVPAKPLASKPDAQLHVRMAVVGDRKERGAAARSRFYLMHPEHDPETRRRRHGESRGGGGGRYRRDDDRRRGGPGRNGRRDDDDEIERYPDNFYDDKPSEPSSSLAKRVGYRDDRDRERGRGRDRDYSRDRRRSYNDDEQRSDEDDHSHRRNHDKELFPGGAGTSRSLRDRISHSPSRNRSASPRRRRRRSRSPLSRSRSRSRTRRPDLFDDARSRNKMLGRAIKDHLADKTRARQKELFPQRQAVAGFDSKNRLDQLESVFGSARLETDDDPLPHPDDVAPAQMDCRQRGINIHGLSTGDGDVGAGGRSDFNIKGVAAAAPPKRTAKELFPDKFGGGHDGGDGGRRDLFSRAGRRQKASDLFD